MGDLEPAFSQLSAGHFLECAIRPAYIAIQPEFFNVVAQFLSVLSCASAATKHAVDQHRQGRTSMSENTFTPGPAPRTVRSADGTVRTVPDGWELLPPGDAALTRRAKLAGDHWIVAEKKGRKVFSRGIWTSAATIERIRADLEAERSTESHVRKMEASARRREKVQAEYVEDFHGAVLTFLRFHPDHADLAQRMAKAVTEHATPVGSGTVARTQRIPVERRAEAAVIAWMRHQTTGYDGMVIPRVKGKRREVRRMLAKRSHDLLERYRRGEPIPESCPLSCALAATAYSSPKFASVAQENR